MLVRQGYVEFDDSQYDTDAEFGSKTYPAHLYTGAINSMVSHYLENHPNQTSEEILNGLCEYHKQWTDSYPKKFERVLNENYLECILPNNTCIKIFPLD